MLKISSDSSTYSTHTAKPQNRSSLRMMIGKYIFTCLRWCSWYIKGIKYASNFNLDQQLPVVHAEHKTPLLRNLRGVDMHLQRNKIANLRLATQRINGIMLNPGETFSLWKLVGKPSRKKGYREGMILVNGAVCTGVAGGLCQLSNLIYWMTLHTPLTVTERWRHDYDVFPDADRTQPFGSGATITYNYIDLQIINKTSEPFQLLLWLDQKNLNGEWRSTKKPDCSYKIYECQPSIVHEWWGGYTRHNTLRRKVCTLSTNEIEDELITGNHAIMMYEPLLPPG